MKKGVQFTDEGKGVLRCAACVCLLSLMSCRLLCSAHAHVTAPLQKASTLETPEAKAAAAAAKEKHEMELLFKQVCALQPLLIAYVGPNF